MATELTKDLFKKMLGAALTAVEKNFDALNELDSATGDGDHGTAVLATMKAAVANAEGSADFSATLTNIAMGIMTATGGSTSSLIGSLYLGMSNSAKKESLNAAETAAMFDAGLTSVRGMTKAKVGDKTMMDALIPAVEAMQQAANGTLADLFEAAAQAADQGRESTKDLTAKMGRARNLGDRSIGHYDAGATSQAIIFRAFADTVKNS